MPTFLNKKIKSSELGFAAFFVTILVLVAMISIAISITALTIGEQKISKDITRTNQAYYAAEAGAEDALLRLTKSKKRSSPYALSVGSASVTTAISEGVGGTATITSEGSIANRIRKVQIVCTISNDEAQFFYGAQVGEGGLTMRNLSQVLGNVFSDGNVTGSGAITNSVIIAGNTHYIDGPSVGEDATVHSCYDSDITGTLYYVSGGVYDTCNGVPPPLKAVQYEEDEIPSVPLPIPESQINDWKIEAATGGVNPGVLGVVKISGTQSMGPIQIGTPDQPVNLEIENKAVLNITGTIYVTGNIITGTSLGTAMRLDSSYGSFGGVVLAHGTINIGNNTDLTGSGQPGSYILLLSDYIGDGAITVNNNAAGDPDSAKVIFYTSAGEIIFKQNAAAREIIGYKVTLDNGAKIQYEFGLLNVGFSGGPGGGWQVEEWKEIQ